MESKENRPRSSLVLLAITVAGALLITTGLVALSELGGRETGGGTGGGSAEKLYADIPQKETTLGRDDAPVMISLYEDFQCPFCGQMARETFPRVVEEYVRSGEVKVVSRPLVFLGEDSVEAAVAALAAGEQDRYWQYHSLLFEEQGAENSGYVTSEFLTGLAEQIPGLNVDAWNKERSDRSSNDSFDAELNEAQADANSAGVNSTPSMVVRGPGGEEKLRGVQDFERVAAAIREAKG